MSADLLARNCVKALRDLRDDKINMLRRCKPRPPTNLEGAVIPAATADEIAFYAIDLNATIDQINKSIELIEKEYKKLTSPEEPASTEPIQARKLY